MRLPAVLTHALVAAVVVITAGLWPEGAWSQQERIQIAIIDFYGLNRLSASDLRRALPFKEGDTLLVTGDDRPAALAAAEQDVAKVPGVVHAHAALVCCDEGRAIVFVGIEEPGAPITHFRTRPTGKARLPPDVIRAGQEFSDALTAAVLHGRAAEDDSQGHALFEDPATRAVQMRFVAYAARDVAQLRRVLRESADDAQRALAAQVLAYVFDKQSVVKDLVEAMDDPSADVRNNAMRSLAVFARMAPDRAHAAVRVPYEPFVQLLHSLLWTDRNKAAMALQGLSVNPGSAAARLAAGQGTRAARRDGTLEERGTCRGRLHGSRPNRGPIRRRHPGCLAGRRPRKAIAAIRGSGARVSGARTSCCGGDFGASGRHRLLCICRQLPRRPSPLES